MPIDDKIAALATASADAQAKFLEAVAPARDAYVQQRQAFAQTEDRWLHDLANDDARVAARDAWQAFTTARKALTDAAATAGTARAATLDAAWADIKTR